MVILKMLNPKNDWKLGKYRIDKVNQHKCLDCYISRSQKSDFHVNCLQKEKANIQLNYLIRIPWQFEHFNIINFGQALQNFVKMPCLAHECTIWMLLSATINEALGRESACEDYVTYQIKYAKIRYSS